MHKDGANETGAKNCNVSGKHNFEAFSAREHNDCKDANQDTLDEKDEDSGLESVLDLIIIQLHLLHAIPIQRSKSHRVCVIIEIQFLVFLFNFIKQALPLLLRVNLMLVLQFHLLDTLLLFWV